MVEGSVTLRYADGGAEVLLTGQAYHIRPGHNVHIDKDTEFVEFTPADQAPGISTPQDVVTHRVRRGSSAAHGPEA